MVSYDQIIMLITSVMFSTPCPHSYGMGGGGGEGNEVLTIFNGLYFKVVLYSFSKPYLTFLFGLSADFPDSNQCEIYTSYWS